MPVAVDAGAEGAHELAQLYAEAVRDLNRHWPGEDGACLGCGDAYPCAEEWITQRAIVGIETRWRLASGRVWELVSAAAAAAWKKGANEPMSIHNATWRRASGCDNSGGSCVEVAMLGDQVITRDSKDPQGTIQVYERSEWATFIAGVKAGEFDG